jgi:hypothetical protein
MLGRVGGVPPFGARHRVIGRAGTLDRYPRQARADEIPTVVDELQTYPGRERADGKDA